MGLSGCAAFHCVAISAPILNEIPASSLRATGMPVSDTALKNEVMMMPFWRAASTPGFAASRIPDVQRGRVHALRHNLVDVRRHGGRVCLAIKHVYVRAVLFLGVLLRLGRLRLVEDIR